ncbi:MAG: tetratricopeptide repeat protein [Anaerolineales bacterium]|nr:tetratricopeptide repeat protein [Anaerolineales bacterium]
MSNLEKILNELQDAEIAGDHLIAAEANSAVGKIFLERNIYPEAANHFRKAASLFSEIGKLIQQANMLNQLGVCLVMSAQEEQALEELAAAKRCLAEEDRPALAAAIEGNLGLAYSGLKDYKNAARHHKSVFDTAEKINDLQLKLNALINLSDSNLQDKKYQPAQGFALVALDLAKTLGSKPSLMIIYDLLGMISSRQGDLKTALEYHQQSFESAQENGDLLRQGIALANQALAQEGLTEMDRAHQLMTQAKEIFTLLNSDYQEKTSKDLERIQSSRSVDS